MLNVLESRPCDPFAHLLGRLEDRFVNELVYFALLDSEMILFDDFKVDAVQLFNNSICIRLIVQEADVNFLADVIDRLCVQRIVH